VVAVAVVAEEVVEVVAVVVEQDNIVDETIVLEWEVMEKKCIIHQHFSNN
jgi:hypothetical protein